MRRPITRHGVPTSAPPPSPLRLLPAAVALAAVLALAGCTDKVSSPQPPPPVLAVPDSIQAIFTAHCAFDGCHAGSGAPRGEDLSDPQRAYELTVGVPSGEKPEFQRIAPGDSANSYLVMKLRDDPRISGVPMPFGAYPLDPALTQRIAQWAQAGAPGTPVSARLVSR
jgi:hypothetical protein